MGDSRITSKNFNPYDLGSVGKAMKELRASGQLRMAHTAPYIPPQPKGQQPSAERKSPARKK